MLKIIVLAINLFYQQNNLLFCFQLFFLLNFFLEGPIATSSYTHCFVKIVAGGCSAATFYVNSGTTFQVVPAQLCVMYGKSKVCDSCHLT